MPSARHEGLIDLFQHSPELTPELPEHVVGLTVPRFERVRLGSTNLSEWQPKEYRADTVVVLEDSGRPVLAVVVEIQLSGDDTRHWSWPVYIATLRARLKCPVMLLVVCTSRPMANRYAGPIDLGHPGLVLTPVVVGPDRLPVIDDVDTASRRPELAVLAAIAHAHRPDIRESLQATVEALQVLDDDRATLYNELLRTALPLAAKRHLEELVVRREFRDPFVRQHVMHGRALEEADVLLRVLNVRGIPVPTTIRELIDTTTDLEQLRAWVDRAAVAHSLDEIFATAQ